MRSLTVGLCLLAALMLVPATAFARHASTRPVGSKPLSDRAAAKRVHRSRWEPRPHNRKANRTRPTRAQLRMFRRRSDMVYARQVTGHFRGTTDEIIQWSAHKHGV